MQMKQGLVNKFTRGKSKGIRLIRRCRSQTFTHIYLFLKQHGNIYNFVNHGCPPTV